MVFVVQTMIYWQVPILFQCPFEAGAEVYIPQMVQVHPPPVLPAIFHSLEKHFTLNH